jgi:hypothetical protein
VARHAGVEGNTVCGTSIASKSAEFSMRNPPFSAWCSSVVKIVVATPAFDCLSVNTEFVRELTN